MTITVNLTPEVADRLRRQAAAQGRDLPGLVQRLAEREAGDVPVPARIPGLHAGQYEASDDFDAPLLAELYAEGESHAGVVFVDNQTIASNESGKLIRTLISL